MSPELSEINQSIREVARAIQTHAGGRGIAFQLDKQELSLLYNLRDGYARKADRGSAIQVGVEIVIREIGLASENQGVRQHSRVLLALISLLRIASDSSPGTRSSAQAMAKAILAGVGSIPGWTQRYIRDAPKASRPRDVGALTGMRAKEWNDFVSDIVVATHTIATPIADRIALTEPAAIDLDVATRLSRIADADEAHPVDVLPEYDQSEKNLRLTSVEVSGFRGAASKVVLDLAKKGRPVDTLLWGDNGVGKSTLIDGIEFALQGRVDRSADFNSTLRSAVRNLAIPEAHASISLSDGSIASRSLFRNEAGCDVPTESAVRPGFRIAPVVIRRADILRFLDTDALSRGAVFFDYFPSPDGSIGARPDEEIRILNEELYTLRVVRDDLAFGSSQSRCRRGFQERF